MVILVLRTALGECWLQDINFLWNSLSPSVSVLLTHYSCHLVLNRKLTSFKLLIHHRLPPSSLRSYRLLISSIFYLPDMDLMLVCHTLMPPPPPAIRNLY